MWTTQVWQFHGDLVADNLVSCYYDCEINCYAIQGWIIVLLLILLTKVNTLYDLGVVLRVINVPGFRGTFDN